MRWHGYRTRENDRVQPCRKVGPTPADTAARLSWVCLCQPDRGTSPREPADLAHRARATERPTHDGGCLLLERGRETCHALPGAPPRATEEYSSCQKGAAL